MSHKDHFVKLDHMLSSLPKPDLDQNKKKIMQQKIIDYHDEFELKATRSHFMKRLIVGTVGISALILFSIIMVGSLNHSKLQMHHNAGIKESHKETVKNNLMNKKAIISTSHNDWEAINRMQYVQGTITDITSASGNVTALKINEKSIFGSDADPVDPMIGTLNEEKTYQLVEEFEEKPIPFKIGDSIIMEFAQYTKNADPNWFWGGKVLYYMRDGKYYDLNGKIANATFSSIVSIHNGELLEQNQENSQNTGQSSIILDSGYQQFSQEGNIVQLNNQLSFQLKNLGGGLSNFEYEISKSTDSGSSWTKQGTVKLSHVTGLSFIDENTGYVVNNSPAFEITPTLYSTHNGGKDWAQQQLPIPEQYKDYYRQGQFPIFFSKSDGVLPIFGFKNNEGNSYLYMLTTNDGGNTWKAVTDNQANNLNWSVEKNAVDIHYNDQTNITIKGN